VAAAMIVVYHSHGFIGVFKISGYSPLMQGVSFFFVLSGFVLAYAYPELPTRQHIYRFLWARFSRIWPMHVTALLVLILLLPFYSWGVSTSHPYFFSIVNLLMIHAWIPVQDSYLGLNSVSWSISTEFFFYLSFPLLIHKWYSTWHIKLVIVFVIWLMTIISVNIFDLDPAGMVYIHPISRLLEFTIGIATCAMFKLILEQEPKISVVQGTGLELLVLLVLIAVFYLIAAMLNNPQLTDFIGIAGRYWLSSSGACFIFAALILIYSFQCGLFSKVLKNKTFVFLGEISFAVYMIHQIIIRSYVYYLGKAFPPSISGAAISWVVTLILSSFIFIYVEKPARIFLIKSYQKVESKESFAILNYFKTGKFVNTLGSIALLLVILVVTNVSLSKIKEQKKESSDATILLTNDALIESLVKNNNELLMPVYFGRLLTLEYVVFIEEDNNLKLTLLWNLLDSDVDGYTIVIHVMDDNKQLINQKAIVIPQMSKKSKQFFTEFIFGNTDKKVSMIGIALFKTVDALIPVRGNPMVDWASTRLLLPVLTTDKSA
jgi:peptidoglycan/LPS O-acetylase OafA/YrhL